MDILQSVIVKLDDINVCLANLKKMDICLSALTNGLQAADMLISNGRAWDNQSCELIKAWVTLEFVVNQFVQGGRV
jgi:hypothetical protein